MQFVGIDLHTDFSPSNRFACCYLEDSSKAKRLETFELD
jgi:hypothetical protein